MGTEVNRGEIDIFGKKMNFWFLNKLEMFLVERQEKCHHLGWTWLPPGTFCGLQQLSLLTRAVVHNVALVFKIESCSKFQVDVSLLKDNGKKLLFIFFNRRCCWNFAIQLWEKSGISTLRNDKRNAKWGKFCSHCFTIILTNRRDGRRLLSLFFNKGWCASAH